MRELLVWKEECYRRILNIFNVPPGFVLAEYIRIICDYKCFVSVVPGLAPVIPHAPRPFPRVSEDIPYLLA